MTTSNISIDSSESGLDAASVIAEKAMPSVVGISTVSQTYYQSIFGVQQGTTAQSYIEGDEAFGFEGLPATCQPYKSGSLAVQDMLNGNIKYVIIDAAPATAITEAINAMQ